MITSRQPDSDIALNWIDGEWVGSDTIAKSVNPATSDVIGRYAGGKRRNRLAAIVAAKRAVKETYRVHDRKLRARFSRSSVMCFEDETIVLSLQEQFPLYAHHLPVWF